eukprot:8597930-Pyramimonas_sp.AAC.2
MFLRPIKRFCTVQPVSHGRASGAPFVKQLSQDDDCFHALEVQDTLRRLTRKTRFQSDGVPAHDEL